MRILFLSDYSDSSGGVERLVKNLRDELLRAGHQVFWLSSSASTTEDSFADQLCFGTTSRFRGTLQFLNPSAVLTLNRVIAAFKPDVVHVAMFLTQLSPAILPILSKIPALYYAQWYRAICLKGTRQLSDGQRCQQRAGLPCLTSKCIPITEWLPLAAGLQLFRHWSNAFRAIVANSNFVKDQLHQYGLPITHVIPCAVESRPQRPALPQQPLVVFAGRLVPEKGAHILIQASKAFPETKFLIAGDGPQKAALQQAAGSNVEFTGHISQTQMESLFNPAWVQVVPSLWDEPFGLTAAEAQMRGTAVIATHSGALPEVVIQNQTGLLTAPGNVTELTSALHQFLSDRKFTDTIGINARNNALNNFSIQMLADRFLQTYKSIA